MEYTWQSGSIPEDKKEYYWIAVKDGDKCKPLNEPCKYDASKKCWIRFGGEELPEECVVSYLKVKPPKKYKVIGDGSGYFIRTVFLGTEVFWGVGMQYARLSRKGYESLEEAMEVLKNRKMKDQNEGHVCSVYEVVNGYGEVVWEPEKARKRYYDRDLSVVTGFFL